MTQPDGAAFSREDRLIRWHLYVSYLALFLGGTFGLLQALARAPSVRLPLPFNLSYYEILTAHGVLLALIFTTFFIMGLLVFATTRSLGVRLLGLGLGWGAFALMVTGTVLATWAILSKQASVLYTFYAPLKAHPAFYIGATLLVVGTWAMALVIFATYRRWRAANPQARVPLPAYGVLVTLIVWVLATLGVAAQLLFLLIPWSLGATELVDPLLSRTLFWYFGHPLVYFWLLAAYIIWYGVAPRLAGGKLFSDPLSRAAFALLLVFSVPVGLHHQLADPGIDTGWKLLQVVTTMAVVVPSLMTAFNLAASFEIGGRARGGRGLLAWIGKLPWGEPTFSGLALAMILFAGGGIGGIINASFNLNAVIHNTSWVPGHLHLTVASAAGLTFMATSYWLLPALTGKALWGRRLALAQTYFWFVGMIIFSGAMHWAGVLGSPRRSQDVTYGNNPVAASWLPQINAAAVGGAFMFTSIALFTLVVVGTLLWRRRQEVSVPWAEAVSGPEAGPRLLDRWPLWIGLAVALALIAYGLPIFQMVTSPGYGSPGFTLW